MLQNPLEESDVKTVSTKVTAPSKAASFTISAKRQMYRQMHSNKSVQPVLHNYLHLDPQKISHVIKPHIHMLQNGQNFVVLNDAHYNLIGERSKPILIPRNCQENAQLLFSHSRMPGSYIYFESMELYKNGSNPYLHININKYHPQDHEAQIRDTYIPCTYDKVASFITIQNSRKGLFFVIDKNSGKLILITLKNNRQKNPKFQIETFSDNESEENKLNQKQQEFIFQDVQTITTQFKFEEGEYFLKMINSQFGDSVLVITNYHMYELDFDSDNIFMKNLDLLPKVNKQIQSTKSDEIIDVGYAINGLKIIFVTRNGYLGTMQAHNIKFVKHLSKVMPEYNFSIKNLQTLVGRIMLETSDSRLILMKESHIISYEKTIELEAVRKDEVQSYTCKANPKTNQLFLQLVTKTQKTRLQVMRRSIVSLGNEFNELFSAYYTQLQEMDGQINLAFSQSNGMVCLSSNHQIKSYRFYEGLSVDTNDIEELFTTSFFEKPISISIHPNGSNLVVHFREFIKFFKFQYENIQSYYTLNIRNISFAGYSQSGQYMMIVKDEKLYLINPYSFKTERVIDAHGDIKNIKFYETIIYLELKNKSSLKQIQILLENNGQYKKIKDTRIENDEAFYIQNNIMIICSSKTIKTFKFEEGQFIEEEKSIKLSSSTQYPTTVELVEDLGFLLIGTNKGKIYQYLWPFTYQSILQHHVINASQSSIIRIHPSVSMQKLYIVTKNKSIIQYNIVQWIEGEQMQNTYVVNPKTLYTQNLKYQFSNKEQLFSNYTSYIHQYQQIANEKIDELEFLNEKRRDDIEQFRTKHKLNTQQEFNQIKNQTKTSKFQGNKQLSGIRHENEQKIGEIDQEVQEMNIFYQEKRSKEIDKYQKTLLQLYKESDRLKNILEGQSNKLQRERDQFRVKNYEHLQEYIKEQQMNQASFKMRFQSAQGDAKLFNANRRLEEQKGEEELQMFMNMLKEQVQNQYDQAQLKKETLIGSINYLEKEIVNYKKRRDEFDSLIMETDLQIDDLNKDKKQYNNKKSYLKKQLKVKEEIIEEKQKQLVHSVKITTSMKKHKQIHAYELEEYLKEISPVSEKMMKIDQEIKQLNGEILKQYRSKIEKENQIEEKTQFHGKLKQQRARKIKIKLQTATTFQRFIEALTTLLDDPLNRNIRHRLYELVIGDRYEINQQQIGLKNANSKLLRKKNFIRKEMSEYEKKEQNLVKNKNQFFKYFNENTLLLRQFQDLKQDQMKLQAQKLTLEQEIQAAKKFMITPQKRTRSMKYFNKTTQKRMTPYQKHEQQYFQMFNKNTLETKPSTAKGQTFTLLKTLMKDVKGSQSRFEKMQLVRERVRSYVNPQLQMTRTIKAKKLFFDQKQY